MKITVDLDKLNKLELTPNQWCLLECLFLNIDTPLITDSELEHAESEGYIKIMPDNLVLRDKGRQLFEAKPSDSLFFEFFSKYPVKVIDGRGGYRILRTKDPDAKSVLELKKKYLTLIKQPGLHEKIIKGLDNYLLNMKTKMQFIVGIEVFINQFLWEKYLDLDETIEEKTEGI